MTQAASAGVADARAAADAAAAAFPAWAALGPGARRARLSKAAALLEACAGEFAAVVREETGATAGWGHFNPHLAAGMLREAAAMTSQIGSEVIPSDVPRSIAMAYRQPAGVVLGIAPWNAPVILGVRALAMPLACGKTVVLKSSEICPATHALIGTVLNDAELGAGVVNVVSTDVKDAGEVSEALIAHPAVKRINFTGSTRVGRLLALTAAKYLKPILLELGAKVLVGGEVKGTIMHGIVVDHVTPDMALFREESFAPQVSITRVDSVDDAVRLANDTEYGLSAAVFTRDLARGLDVARRIESGICHVNGPTVHGEAQMPFGGVKASGYGRFGGRAAIDAFSELRWITLQTSPRHYPF